MVQMGLFVYHLSDYFDASISSVGGAVFVRPNTPRADFWTHGRGLTIGRMISDPGQVLLLIRPENVRLGAIQGYPQKTPGLYPWRWRGISVITGSTSFVTMT